MKLKQVIKAISKSDGFRKCLCWLGALYMRLVYATTRWTVIKGAVPQKFWDQDKPFILALWHGRLLMMPYCWNQKKNIHMLISQHRDGQLIAQTIGHIGIQTIEGSSSKGGATALRAMLRALKAGDSIGITPDGPRGPRMRASAGIANVAKISGVPIIPCSVGTTSRKHLKSWDRFCVSFPFSKGTFVWGDPIHVPKKSTKEELATLQITIENALTQVTNEADRLSGHPLIEPDERLEETS